MTGDPRPTTLYRHLIRYRREEKGWTLEDMAKKLKMPTEKYERLESGKLFLNVGLLERLADIFGLPISELIPSLAGKYTVSQPEINSFDNGLSSGITVHEGDFESERESWQKLDLARQETIVALQQTVAAQAMALDVLKNERPKH